MEKNKRLTTIQISEDTWNKLSKTKGLGDSFDDVIVKLIKGSKK